MLKEATITRKVHNREVETTAKLTVFINTASTEQLVTYIQNLQQISAVALDTNIGATEVKIQEAEMTKAVKNQLRNAKKLEDEISAENIALKKQNLTNQSIIQDLQEQLRSSKAKDRELIVC